MRTFSKFEVSFIAVLVTAVATTAFSTFVGQQQEKEAYRHGVAAMELAAHKCVGAERPHECLNIAFLPLYYGEYARPVKQITMK